MKVFFKSTLVAVSLLISVEVGFAAEKESTTADLKGAASSVGTGLKSDLKGAAVSAKGYAKVKAADAKTAVKAKLVDINTATAEEIKAVPGIGEALADKIIAGRPYANKRQLKSRKIVPANIYEQVKNLIIAKVIK